MNIKTLAAAAALMMTLFAGSIRANEVPEVKIALQPGLAYTAQMIMQERRLVEKYLKEAGLENTKVSYVTFGSGGAMNDAILSGAAHFGASGVPPVMSLWSRALGTRNEVRACTAIIAEPILMLTRDANLKSIKDIADKDRISVPAVKVSLQAVLLQMAAAQIYGDKNYERLDKQTVSFSHPDGLAAVLSGGEIATIMTGAPYVAIGLERGLRPIYNSYDVLGRHGTTALLWSGKAFRDSSPKTFHAVMKAFMEANEVIKNDPKTTAQIYLRVGKEKFTPEFIEKNLRDPEISFRSRPTGIQPYFDFMHKVGTVKQKANWKELFFPDCEQYWKD